MDIEKVVHMNGGEGDSSYTKNSLYQKGVMLKVKPILEESITDLYCTSLTECLKVGDLGCSSGPNAVLPLWEIIVTIDKTCHRLNREVPAVQAFLNDVSWSDFNAVFRSLPIFYQKIEKEIGEHFGPCFVAGMPGSFHKRLFPDLSIHFFHSSYSVHFLSQLPEGLESESGVPLNKGNICVAKTSPPSVRKAYLDQFETDFITFLRLRSEELVPGGRMVHTILGRTDAMNDPCCKHSCEWWSLIGMALNDMAIEGLIEQSTLDSFNVPLYIPSKEEVRHLIEKEGSFHIARFEAFLHDWDANMQDGNNDPVPDKFERGKQVANLMRAVAEPVLTEHFGKKIIDDLVRRLSLKAAEYLEMGTGVSNSLVVSLVKK